MTSRERVRAVLDGDVPDRVPIDCGGTDVTGFHGIAYAAVKTHLGLSGGMIRLFHTVMQLAAVEDDVRQRFSGDVIRLSFEPKAWKEGTLSDGTPCEVPEEWRTASLPDGSEALMAPDGRPMLKRLSESAWFSPVGPLFPSIQTADDIPRYHDVLRMMDHAAWLDESIEDLAARARKIRTGTDCAIAGVFGGHVFAQAQLIRGMDNFMCDLAENPKLACALMDTLAELHMEAFERYSAALGPYLDVVCVADDLGTQEGPQIAPRMFRRLVKPYMGKLYGFMRSRMSNAKLFLHSCGSVYDLIPDLIEIGVDILNPVQVSAKHMDSAKLKAEFGSDIVFWGGGCDTQTVLPRRSPADVRDEVKRRMDDSAPGGGFVFSQVHNIQPGVPPGNIVAMYDAARERGMY